MKPAEKRYFIVASLCIVAAGIAVYANSLDGKFVWDDYYLIEHNVYIRDISFLPNIFAESIFAGAGRKSHFWRPMQALTYMLDYSVWGLDERGYHVTNATLHILSALCLFWFIYLLFGDRLISSVTGILFVVHPVHTEAVSYISGRADSLSVIFMLLAFISYIRYLSRPKLLSLMLAGSSFIISLLSKEAALILPVLIIIYHYAFKKRIQARAFIPVCMIAFSYIIIRYTLLRGLGYEQIRQSTALQRTPGFFVAIAQYIRLLLFPFGLHMEYGDRLFAIAEPKALAGMLILGLLIYYAFRQRKSKGVVLFSICWFLTALLPYTNIYPINAYMAEHWLYIPSMGFFLALSAGLSYLCRRQNLKLLGITGCVLIVLYYSYITIRQNRYWREPVAFYENTLKYFPGNARLYNNLAIAYFKAGRVQEAIGLLEEAIKIRPDYPETYINLGNIYSKTDEAEKAIELYKKSLEIFPQNPKAYNNLGNAYSRLGRDMEAAQSYKRAIELNPNYPEPYNNLAVIYDAMGRRQEAVKLYLKSIRLDPNQAGAYTNLANAYFKLERLDEAIESLERAIELRPERPGPYFNLSLIYHSKGMPEEALRYCQKAQRLGYNIDPEFLKALKAGLDKR